MDKIQQLQGEAQYLNSDTFSLDSLRARQKLAEFQLPDSGLWLVKLVQAAVALRAPSIQIGFARNCVKVQFEADTLPDAQDLLNHVMAGHLPQPDGLFHLVTGLRACSGGNTEAIEWSCGSSRVKLDQAGSTSLVNLTPGFRLVASRPPRQRSLSETLATPVSHWLRNVAQEYDAVAQRCWVCPIPILLDGRQLERGYHSTLLRGLLHDPGSVLMQYEKSHANIPAFCVGLRQIAPLSQRPRLRALSSQAQLHKPVLKNGLFFHWEDEGDPIGAALSLQAYRACPNQIDFVWDGAVVASHQFHWNIPEPRSFGVRSHHNLGVRLIFAVDPQELDLSQFEVRAKAELAGQLLERVKPALIELIERLLAEIESLIYVPFTPNHGKAVGIGAGTYALGGAMALGAWFLLPVGMVAGGVMSATIYKCRRKIQASLKALLTHLKS